MRVYAWSWPDESAEQIRRGEEVANVLRVPHALGSALSNRGMDSSAARDLAGQSLQATTEDLGEPQGVEEAAAELLRGARRGRVGIICDYDVDGATSQAILVETLRAILPAASTKPVVVVPERNTEGFGPNARCLNRMVFEGASCVAVLDCGTSSGRLLDRFYASTRIAPVVVDHHPAHADPPPKAGCLVNPWVTGVPDPGQQGTLCAAALTWFVARSLIRQAGLSARETVILRKRITLLAALGTACDMMRLDTPFNRTLIRVGVKLLADPRVRSPGLTGICEAAGLEGDPKADDFAWRIGPRLNAGSRMGESDLAARCLRAKKVRGARKLAEQLDEHNQARRSQSDEAAQELEDSPDLRAFEEGPVNVYLSGVATPGTVGLVASKLVRRFGWPAVALSKRNEGSLAGSGRSTLDFDIGAAVFAALEEGILLSGGGHARACGLEVEPSRTEDLKAFLHEKFREGAGSDGKPKQPTHLIDAVLHGEALAGETMLAIAEAQRRLEPWGPGLRLPIFGVRKCSLDRRPRRRKEHVFMNLASGERRFNAVWWRSPPDWHERLGLDPNGGLPGGRSVHGVEVVGRVALDDWQGRRSGRFEIKDARISPS